MLMGLLCASLGTAWAADDWGSGAAGGDEWGGAADSENEWTGEFSTPGNLSITVAPLRLAGQEFTQGGLIRTGEPMLDMAVEFRVGETTSIAFTGATSLARVTGMAKQIDLPDIDIPGIEPNPDEPAKGSGGETGPNAEAGAQPGAQPSANPNPRDTPGAPDRPTYPGSIAAPVEVGLQVREYVAGGFDNGLFLGAQLGVTNPNLRTLRSESTRIGPMAGIKVTLSIITVEARAGADLNLGRQGFYATPRVDFATGLTF